MECQFEEKHYEQPLNVELGMKRKIISVGQVHESYIGIDAALFSKNPSFWRLWSPLWWLAPLLPPRRGIPLEKDFWDTTRIALDKSPIKFKCNLFIQHKRPEYIKSVLGKEFPTWNEPYFRYGLDENQQKKLLSLERHVSSSALVVYACPAFRTFEDLVRFMNAGRLVENSNFVQPTTLSGHSRFTFIHAGRNGIVFSEPKKLQSIDILEQFDRLFERTKLPERNSGFVLQVFRDIERSVIASEDVKFEKTRRQVMEYYGIPVHELGRATVEILSFLFLTNISWSIGYEVLAAHEQP